MKLLRKRACPKRNVSANSVFSDLLQLQLHFSHVHPVCVCVCVCNISFFACLQQLCVRWVCVCGCVYVCVLLLCLPRTQRRRRCSCSCCYCCVFFLFFIGSCSGKEKGCVPAVKTVKTTNETKLLLQPHPFCELFRVKQQLINCTQGKRNYKLQQKVHAKKMSIIMHVQQQQTHVTELPPGGLSLPPTPPTPPALFLLPARC